MLQGYDEAELLALIEDELDPGEAERLRLRLARDPQALALIERIREDRARLRATPEPQVPGGLLAEIEPLLARPMLMPKTPARRRRRRPLVSAVAAAVALATVAGLWATLVAVLAPGAPEAIELAETNTTLPPAAAIEPGPRPPTAPTGADRKTWNPPGTVIHHHGPLVAVSGRPLVATAAGDTARAARDGEPQLVASDFMLVVRARDASEAERVLLRVVSDLGAETALVRNFTYEEADVLEEARRLAEGRRPAETSDAAEMVADVLGPAAARRGTDRMPPGRQRPGAPPGQVGHGRPRPRPQDQPEARLSRSELLAGSTELAPSFERQLDFSQRGAAYTLSVPAARLTQVLARLQLDEEHQTVLRVEAGEGGDDVTDELRWLRDWPLARQAVAAMDTQGRDAVILLPVVVEQP